MFFNIILSIIFLIFVFPKIMNYICDTYFGTNYRNKPINNNGKRKVRFADDEVKHYHLSQQEKNMKRKAYRQIRKQSNHYRQVDQLCWSIEGLKIN